VLDGRNRAAALERLGRDPLAYAETVPLADEAAALAYVLSINLMRRHLSTSQRAMLAARLLPLYEAAALERQRRGTSGSHDPEVGRSRDVVAEQVGVSGPSVQRAKALLEEAPREVILAVERGEATVTAALREVRGAAPPPSKAKRERDVLDRAYTPSWAAQALWAMLPAAARSEGRVAIDPCAGAGALLWPAYDLGLEALAADVQPQDDLQRGDILLRRHQIDLLEPGEAEDWLEGVPWERRLIVTNTPYMVPHGLGVVERGGEPHATATQFIRRCLELAPVVCALVRLSWLEPCEDRLDLLRDDPRLIILPRVRFETPEGVQDYEGTDSQTSCWAIWGLSGLSRIAWVGAEDARQWGRQ
jgi:hypothetical protein